MCERKYSVKLCANVFYVYRPIVGKVQLAAPIKGITYGCRELALVRPYVIPFIETRMFLPTIGCFIGFCQYVTK